MPRSDAPIPDELTRLPPGGELGALLARLLRSRGITSTAAADAFLEPTLARGLRPPSMIPGLESAAAALADAMDAGTGVRVLADTSVEGLVAGAILSEWLGDAPAAREHTITVGRAEMDVGGTRLDGARIGLDVAGVAFYLLIALRIARRRRGRSESPDPRAALDLVALATLAAGTTLRDETRVLVALGLRRMQHRQRPGLAALADSASIARFTARAMLTRVVPRLAAAVALGEAPLVRALLTASTADVAMSHAAAIELVAARWQPHAAEVDPIAPLLVDAEWSLAGVTPRLALAIDRLEPCGPGNPEPVLVARGARLDGAKLAGDPTRPYWRMRFRQDSHTVRAVAQRLPGVEIVVERLYDVAYSPRMAQVRGSGAIEIAVHDLHEHTPLATGQANETTE